jgi:ATP-dependent exoDNAse (exonuclease V) alpha subunit
MSIDHLHIYRVSRRKGHHVVAAAAYRAGEKIVDEHEGTTHDFRRRGGVEAAFVMAPAGVEWVQDRAVLWNRVEVHEKRNDARLATEVRVGIPHELDKAQREHLVREFAQGLIDRYGVAIDVAIHEPTSQWTNAIGMLTSCSRRAK